MFFVKSILYSFLFLEAIGMANQKTYFLRRFINGNSVSDLRNPDTVLHSDGGLLVDNDLSVIKCKTADEDFFRYNLIAKEIRDKIIEP